MHKLVLLIEIMRVFGVQMAYPEDFANRDKDKFNYRYRGECYATQAIGYTRLTLFNSQEGNHIEMLLFDSNLLSWSLRGKTIY